MIFFGKPSSQTTCVQDYLKKMNLFLKPLVRHATIPANSRQIPAMSKKSRII